MSHRRSPKVTHDDPGMIGERSRNSGGELRRKRGDTKVGTLEEQYHADFGVRDDMKLETLRKKMGEEAILKLIERSRS